MRTEPVIARSTSQPRAHAATGASREAGRATPSGIKKTAPAVTGGEPGGEGHDDGLRTMLVWVMVALVLTVIAAALIAQLAIHWFDVP